MAVGGDGMDGLTGAELNIAVNSPGADFGAGSDGAELSRSGKLKMLANSSGEADLKPGVASAAAAGEGGGVCGILAADGDGDARRAGRGEAAILLEPDAG